jgi:UDP-2-acetamido-3-amino-2,3-dideoxy-glucuronate N-acetyltransferase
MMSSQRSVAVIGYGVWGRNIARNLASLDALGAICDSKPDALDEAHRRYPGVEVHPSIEAVMADARVTAWAIATPPASHADIARLALEADKDVFVEKPLALTTADGQALVDIARQRERVLMVGHLLEYHPAVERLRELIRVGDLGHLQYIYATRLNLGRIRTEENALWSFAPHDIHVLLRLLGERPQEVACHGGTYLHQGVADVTMTLLTFRGGVRAHVFVSWLHPYKEHKLIVVGSRGMAVFDDTVPFAEKLTLYRHRVDWVENLPVAVRAEGEAIPLPDREPLEMEFRHFLECLATRERPRTDGDNGVLVLRVLEACQESLRRGGLPISGDTGAGRATEYFAHPTATLDAGCEIGAGTRVWHYTHVMAGARIGRRCSLGQNVFVGDEAVIGDHVKIQNNVSIYDGVILEDDVFCGPSMVFTNVVNPRSYLSRRHELRRTLVRRGATIGANATIVCGHTVGCHAFVGAGAVVTTDVPDHALMLGVPARVAGWVCRCGVRLPMGVDDGEETQPCPACGARYARAGDVVSASAGGQ